jgi:transcriptional regulator with GAF, ATPase, and Fis domain
MLQTLRSNGNLTLLAGYDFLDLCLLGETGTGKTHTARLIHDMSPRAKKPFVAVNCAELTPSIIESELFGYEKGAFTGATSTREGKFEAAAGGTLFLDEIGELTVNLQAKLLKIVEEKNVTRVGGNRSRPVDVRIVYATHRDPAVFREDIRYRITAHAVCLKPLRERIEQIVPLAQEFLQNFNSKSGRNVWAKEDVLCQLETAPWHGNIRELRSFVEKACLDALFAADAAGDRAHKVILTREIVESRLKKKGLTPGNSPSSPLGPWPQFIPGQRMVEYLERIETDLLKSALESNNHNQTRAARDLGISRSGLIKKLKRLAH